MCFTRNVMKMQINTSFRYGCCHDGVTIAQSPNKEGCPDSRPHWSPAVSIPFADIKFVWNDPEQCSSCYVPVQFLPVQFCFHLASVLRSSFSFYYSKHLSVLNSQWWMMVEVIYSARLSQSAIITHLPALCEIN